MGFVGDEQAPNVRTSTARIGVVCAFIVPSHEKTLCLRQEGAPGGYRRRTISASTIGELQADRILGEIEGKNPKFQGVLWFGVIPLGRLGFSVTTANAYAVRIGGLSLERITLARSGRGYADTERQEAEPESSAGHTTPGVTPREAVPPAPIGVNLTTQSLLT